MIVVIIIILFGSDGRLKPVWVRVPSGPRWRSPRRTSGRTSAWPRDYTSLMTGVIRRHHLGGLKACSQNPRRARFPAIGTGRIWKGILWTHGRILINTRVRDRITRTVMIFIRWAPMAWKGRRMTLITGDGTDDTDSSADFTDFFRSHNQCNPFQISVISDKGITLVEVLLAVVVLSVGLTGVLRAYLTSIGALEASRETVITIELLKEKNGGR